jgi:hypothetical protein
MNDKTLELAEAIDAVREWVARRGLVVVDDGPDGWSVVDTNRNETHKHQTLKDAIMDALYDVFDQGQDA